MLFSIRSFAPLLLARLKIAWQHKNETAFRKALTRPACSVSPALHPVGGRVPTRKRSRVTYTQELQAKQEAALKEKRLASRGGRSHDPERSSHLVEVSSTPSAILCTSAAVYTHAGAVLGSVL